MKTSRLISLMVISIWGLFCSCTTVYQRQEAAQINKNDIYKMLYYASLAGSSHNSQPWKVQVTRDSLIRLYADTTRALTVVDPDRRELYISLGAFIENFNLAAGSLGYNSTVKLIDDKKNITLVAEIHLNKALSTHYHLELIEKRRTLRTPFDTTSISKKDINQLLAADSQQIHFYPAHSKEGSLIAQKTVEAYTQQAHNLAAQNELAGWLRFSDKDVSEKKDGLSTAGMQIEGFSGFFVRHFLKPADSKKASFIEGGIDKTKKQAMNCGGWVVITSFENRIVDWIKLGRLYEHIHLSCTELQIGFQPMNQIIEEQDFKNEVTKSLGIQEELLFIARVGYIANIPAPVSPRRPVETFTTFEK
jgi:hypothetical protein